VLTAEEVAVCQVVAEELGRAAAEAQLRRRVATSERSTKKGPGDWVTVVDIEIERRTRDRIAEEFPGHVVWGEELGSSGDRASGAPVWYLDPIDGTSNFVHGLPWSSFSLAVADEGGLAAGVVADGQRGEIFSARRGGGAFADGVPISCSDEAGLEGGLVLSELLGTAPWPGLAAMLDRLQERACVTRIPGSTALSLACFAAGRAQAMVLGGYHPIDVAAGMLLAIESGAVLLAPRGADPVVTAWARQSAAAGTSGAGGPEGGERPGADLLVAAAPGVLAELLDVLAEAVG
jgi:myo-inositol-1(or 4)-monophosphatase